MNTSHLVQSQRLGAYGLILEGDAILLCRLSPGNASSGLWTLPGGGMEFGEHPEDAMIREVHEETGLIVSSQGLLRVESERFDFENQDFHALRFYYRAVSAGGTLTHEVSGSTDLCEWIPLNAVRDLPAVPIVQRGIDLIA